MKATNKTYFVFCLSALLLGFQMADSEFMVTSKSGYILSPRKGVIIQTEVNGKKNMSLLLSKTYGDKIQFFHLDSIYHKSGTKVSKGDTLAKMKFSKERGMFCCEVLLGLPWEGRNPNKYFRTKRQTLIRNE